MTPNYMYLEIKMTLKSKFRVKFNTGIICIVIYLRELGLVGQGYGV